jgi:pimeloyl-ACP methyl ester carboxylesterase
VHTFEVTDLASVGRTESGIAYEIAGVGDPIVLVHAGIADRRMWNPQWAALSAVGRVIRYDARGYGESLPPSGPWSHHADLLELLDELGIPNARLIGASMGAGIAVEAALARPRAIRGLFLSAPGGALLGDGAESLRPIWHDEVQALDRGDLDEAVEVNLRAWVDGPSRSPEDLDPEVRSFVGRMQHDAFELPEWDQATAPESELTPPAAVRLAEIACPTLVLVGELDQQATLDAAGRLGAEVPRVRVEVWPDVAHLPSLERPTDFERLALEFISSTQ